jgi:hypothetical protein
MAEIIARAESLEDAYTAIAESAKDEGVVLPTFEEKRKAIEERKKKHNMMTES